ncbi:MAG: hypothetical protein K8R23_01675 [Chthoniobacter sp.]|nr:hypothetical protein [Chthoniobacter sp.]
MKFRNGLFLAAIVAGTLPLGAQSTSVSYSIEPAGFDPSGGRAASSDYSHQSGVSALGALGTSADYQIKAGYTFQPYDIIGLVANSAAPTVDEGATLQLAAWQFLDDATFLAVSPNLVTWSVASAVVGVVPLSVIDANGVTTAQPVYVDSPATVQASLAGFSGNVNVIVRNVVTDNFGAYAGDTIDDAWQVQYFGQNNPNAGPTVDFSHTGQPNLFKYLAGLNPLDPNARFTVAIAPFSGLPEPKTVIFGPLADGRTYTVTYKTDLDAAVWLPLSGATFTDANQQRTVIDPAPSVPRRYYRVEITKP